MISFINSLKVKLLKKFSKKKEKSLQKENLAPATLSDAVVSFVNCKLDE